MDTNALHRCFEATLQADPNTRMEAELQLKTAENVPGFIGGCLDIVLEPQVSDPVKAAAVIYLKNKVDRFWSPLLPVPNPIDQEEMPVFRERLIPALVKVSPHCRSILVKVLNIIVARDFPNKWPELLDSSLVLFQNSDVDSLRAGLTCLLEVCKYYRWTTGEKRNGLDKVVSASFKGVHGIGKSLVSETSNTAGEMLKDILKIYKCATYQEIPKELQEPQQMTDWGSLMLEVIRKDLPEDVLKLSEEERETNSWVKCKKWAFKNLHRLFSRYSLNARHLPAKKNAVYADFANNFIDNYVPEILRVYFEQIELWVSKRTWLGQASISNILAFLEECIGTKSTWALLKPHSELIISHVVFPLLCTTDSDIEIFETDPEEYIHKHLDLYEENPTPDSAATSYLICLVKKKSRFCLSSLLSFVEGVITNHLQNPADLDLARQQEGALRIMGSIAHLVLAKGSPISHNIESFISQYVFPDFASPHGFLRARACQFLNLYADVEFNNPDNISFAYTSTLKCMDDDNLPVQIEAALALQPLVKHEQIRATLSHRIPEVMTRLLDLANKIDVDAIAGVIEEFVEVFSEQLTPFAVDLTRKMSDQLMRLLGELAEQQNADIDIETYDDSANEDKTMTALGVLNTVATLLLALDNASVVVLELEQILKPVIELVFRARMNDFYVEVFGIIDNCTYCLKTVSPTMWSLLPQLHEVFQDDALDYMNELSPSLENYLQYGAHQIGSSPEFCAIYYNIFSSVMEEGDRLGEEDRVVACSIGQRFILSLEGKIDQYVPLMLKTVVTRLQAESPVRHVPYLVGMLEVILAGICYNARATLAILEEMSYTQQFFSLWFDKMEKFARVYDLKLVILSMISLFSLPDSDIPSVIQSNLGQISKGMVSVVARLPTAIKNREDIDKDVDDLNLDYNADYSEEWNDEDDEDEEDQDQSTKEYVNFLESETSQIQSGLSGGFYSSLDSLEEEPLSETVLDSVNPFANLRDLFVNLKQNNPARYEALTGNYTPEEVTVIDEATKL